MNPLHFDNRFLREFPEIATPVKATPVTKPELLIWSEDAARDLLKLDPPKDPFGIEAQVFAGNQQVEGMQSYATRYGGHQFGHWAGQLGDGRAILLGEVVNPTSSAERVEVQLKGAGQTPYSRRGDGRAVLRSSLREFICSEAMHFLGVPTTRALCCVLTGEPVIRDMFYSGDPQPEPGAITTRLAPSFLRLGHFQILAVDDNTELLRKLVDYTMNTYYPHVNGDQENWFAEVCTRTAELMVHWQRVGFVHGVMNTDNLSVLGLTVDYGPYGWMDVYDPDWTPNTTDAENRRYRYGQQPAVALWNLQRFGEALAELSPDHTAWLQNGLQLYATTYNDSVMKMMARKLGLETFPVELVTSLDQALREVEVDMTFFYRYLSRVRGGAKSEVKDPAAALAIVADAFYQWPTTPAARAKFEAWFEKYLELARMDTRDADKVACDMDAINPYFIPRNFLLQEALDGIAKNDRTPMNQLMVALKTPYEENAATRPFFRKLPEWARNRPGCSALSCSS
jgi:uncharacterized protein YdiU (UPF0061 family)